MATIYDLLQQHQVLLSKLDETKDFSQLLTDVFKFLDDIEKASSEISSGRGREQLQSLIRFWGANIYDNTGKYPNTKLRPSLNLENEEKLTDNSRGVIPYAATKTLPEIEQEFSALLNQEQPSAYKLKELLTGLTDFINSDEYDYLTFEDKAQVQELLSSMNSKGIELFPQYDSLDNLPIRKESSAFAREFAEHDENAEQLMDEAEEHFYSGRYQDAIKLYDQVLKIEPSWERAREHREQARKFVLSGEIPSVALPPEAAISYGKAQSAIRVGRLNDARQHFNHAKEVLAQNGITKWNDGQDFEIMLDALIQAESTVKEAIESFNQGKVDNAIQVLDSVYRETKIPRHKDLADKYRNFQTLQLQIADILYSATTSSTDLMLQAAQRMEKLSVEFEGHPALQSLHMRFESMKPALIGSLHQEIRNLKIQADRAQLIDEARQYGLAAINRADLALKLGPSDGMLGEAIQEVHHLLADLDKLSQDLVRAESSLKKNKTWPRDAWNISKEVRDHFPNDPSVIRLNKELSAYRYLTVSIKLVILFVISLVLIWLGTWALPRIYDYFTFR